MREKAALEALAQALAEKVGRKTGKAQHLSAHPPDRELEISGWDDATRQLCLRRIRLLNRAYQLEWLIQQHLLSRPSIDVLSNRQLRMLLADAEHAREAICEGFPLEQTGLIKNLADHLPRD